MRPIFSHNIILCLLFLLENRFLARAVPEAWCDKADTDCYFRLVVDYGLTMMHGKTLAKARNGRLYRYDAESYTKDAELPVEEIIVGDGYLEPKFVMVYNGSLPGPSLHMYEGQNIHLRVTNLMKHETTTVHLHGQYQRRTPYSDGVPFVTQCPILPSQTFTQIFKAEPKGTFFYHSHSGPQATNGLYGAFIVHSRTTETYDVAKLEPEKNQPHNFQILETQEHILFFQDYNHDWDGNIITMKMRQGQYKHGRKIPSTKNLAGINYSLFHYHAGLINGRARISDDGGEESEAPLSTFTVKRNTFTRFRLVNSGAINPFRIAVESHKLLVTATDGYDVEPVLVDNVIINPGERVDFVILSNQPAGNYWIFGQTLEVGREHIAEAILNYEGYPLEQGPRGFDPFKDWCVPTVVLNCPFSYFPEESKTTCLNFNEVKAREPNHEEFTEYKSNGFQEFFLNFAFPGITSTPSSVNGRAFKYPGISLVTQPKASFLTCDQVDCGHDKICHCPYTIDIQRNSIVQLVLTNIGMGKGWDHPVHLHGHGFQVIKMGYPTYNRTTGKFIEETKDISCTNQFCNQGMWADQSWNNGNVQGANLHNPPVKDNLIVMSGGYAVIRFKADNPGMWMIHCHLGLHLYDGMAALISEDKDNWPKRPTGFPKCKNYVPDDNN